MVVRFHFSDIFYGATFAADGNWRAHVATIICCPNLNVWNFAPPKVDNVCIRLGNSGIIEQLKINTLILVKVSCNLSDGYTIIDVIITVWVFMNATPQFNVLQSVAVNTMMKK